MATAALSSPWAARSPTQHAARRAPAIGGARGPVVVNVAARRWLASNPLQGWRWEETAMQQLAYPVRFTVDYPDRPLDRLTTGLRIFVAIPILIVLGTVSGGTWQWSSNGN